LSCMSLPSRRPSAEYAFCGRFQNEANLISGSSVASLICPTPKGDQPSPEKIETMEACPR
jgi:hypothetical protein